MGDERRFFDFDTSNYSPRDKRIYHALRRTESAIQRMEPHSRWVFAILAFILLATLALAYAIITDDAVWWQGLLFVIGTLAAAILVFGWGALLIVSSLKVSLGSQPVSQPFRTLASLAKPFQGRKWILVLGTFIIIIPLFLVQAWWSITLAAIVLFVSVSLWALVH